MPLNFNKYSMKNYFDNTFVMELIRGCTQGCPYCCNSVINKYDKVDISIYNKYFQYLNKKSSSTGIFLYAPELNTNKEYFINTCKYLYKNVKNPISMFVNLDKMDDEQFEWILKLNLFELKFAIDGIVEHTKYRKWDNLERTYEYLKTLTNIRKSSNIEITCHMVANAPNYVLLNWDTYKDIFLRFSDIIKYSEFYLMTSVDYFHHPEKYGISFLYYQNRYKELFAINDVISKVPVMYFREDINRKELANRKYDVLRHLKKQIITDMLHIKQNTNLYGVLNLMCQIYPDLDLINNRDKQIDKYIENYVNNIGYKLKPLDNDLQHKVHNLFDKHIKKVK